MNFHTSSLMLRHCALTNNRRNSCVGSKSFTWETCPLSRSTQSIFYLRVSWVSARRGEFLCHLGIPHLICATFPVSFFMFLDSYRLLFSCSLPRNHLFVILPTFPCSLCGKKEGCKFVLVSFTNYPVPFLFPLRSPNK